MKFTIRTQIIILFAAAVSLTVLFALVQNWNIVTITGKFTLMEKYDNLFNYVLEVRRYEKNYVLYRDRNSLREATRYLDRAGKLIVQLTDNIERIVGRPRLERIKAAFAAYKKILNERAVFIGSPAKTLDAKALRARGQELVNLTQDLLSVKRRRIHQALRRTLGLPLPFLAGLALLLLLMGLLVRRNILRPLALIQRTTKTVAEGNFAPIPYSQKSKDEVTDLMVAFNKMAHEIENRQEALVQARKIAAIGTFTSGIAHELNNPINNIRLTAETLLDDLEALSQDETRELATDILTQADRASEIVKNLLEFSRTDSPSSMRRLSVKEVLERTYKLVKNQIVVDGITLNSDLPDALPPTYGNLQNLQQVFLNLLLNAVQAMPAGGTITVRAQRESDHLIRIDVSDTGSGIKPDDLDHIFDPFYTTKEFGTGTGLGLSVTYSIVKKHGGYIEVKSELGRGTTFSVFLPVVRT